MDEETDSLTRGLVRCDEAAWRQLHRCYFASIRAQAISRGVPESEAAEVVQRVYLRVLRHAKVIGERSDFAAWLACLTRCEAIDLSRRAKRRGWLGERFQQWQQLRANGQVRDTGALESAMLSLDEGERSLIVRHYFEGWSQEEIAREQTTTVKAVESKLARLRRRLREELENPGTC